MRYTLIDFFRKKGGTRFVLIIDLSSSEVTILESSGARLEGGNLSLKVVAGDYWRERLEKVGGLWFWSLINEFPNLSEAQLKLAYRKEFNIDLR